MLANFVEIDAFEEERKKEQVQQSKEAYDQWKAQKDFEMRLRKQSEALDRQRQRGRPLSNGVIVHSILIFTQNIDLGTAFVKVHVKFNSLNKHV